jgi:hypothetical protein
MKEDVESAVVEFFKMQLAKYFSELKKLLELHVKLLVGFRPDMHKQVCFIRKNRLLVAGFLAEMLGAVTLDVLQGMKLEHVHGERGESAVLFVIQLLAIRIFFFCFSYFFAGLFYLFFDKRIVFDV